MTLIDFRKTIPNRELTIPEILSGAMRIMERNFERCLILACLIYIPINLLLEYALLQFPEELTLAQMSSVSLMQLVASIVGMSATCIAAVITEDQLKEDQVPKFGDQFYQGIRRWPMFFVTLLMAGLLFAAAMMAAAFISFSTPMFMTVGMILVMLIAFVFVIFMYNICAVSVLRGYGFNKCITYVRLITHGHLGKNVLVVILCSVIASVVKLPITILTETLMTGLGNPIASVIVLGIVGGVMSVTSIFADIGIVLYFLNMEMSWFRNQKNG